MHPQNAEVSYYSAICGERSLQFAELAFRKSLQFAEFFPANCRDSTIPVPGPDSEFACCHIK